MALRNRLSGVASFASAAGGGGDDGEAAVQRGVAASRRRGGATAGAAGRAAKGRLDRPAAVRGANRAGDGANAAMAGAQEAQARRGWKRSQRYEAVLAGVNGL